MNREAARWEARLRSPECSVQERAEFARWRDAAPENAARMGELSAAIRLLAEAGPGDVGRLDYARRSGARWIWPAAVAASLVLAVVGWAGAGPMGARDRLYSSSPTAARMLRLADGSTVRLAQGSAMLVKASGGNEVTLLAGDARFAAARGAARPLVVRVADRRLTAAGTEFRVGLLPGSIRVNATRGSLRVRCWHGLLPAEMTLREGHGILAEIGSDHVRMESAT